LSAVNFVYAQKQTDPPVVINSPASAPVPTTPLQPLEIRQTALDLQEHFNAEADRQIDRIDKLLMWIIGIGTVMLAVVSIIGGYLIWRSEQLKKHAQDDLGEIKENKKLIQQYVIEAEESKSQIVAQLSSVTPIFNKFLKEAKTISDYEEVAQRSVEFIEGLKGEISSTEPPLTRSAERFLNKFYAENSRGKSNLLEAIRNSLVHNKEMKEKKNDMPSTSTIFTCKHCDLYIRHNKRYTC
jgi:hypothetical protein